VSTDKKITDLTDYTSVLPYASELFGVYQPMIGWKSKRIQERMKLGLVDTQTLLLQALTRGYDAVTESGFSDEACLAKLAIHVGTPHIHTLTKRNNSMLLRSLIATLPPKAPPADGEWRKYINIDQVEALLVTAARYYEASHKEQCTSLAGRDVIIATTYSVPTKNVDQLLKLKNALEMRTTRLINEESVIAAAILSMVDNGMFAQLTEMFYDKPDADLDLAYKQALALANSDDPFATFDPKREISSVSLSPLGIVHIFRQYFFELDTFLGTPTGHVWLSPGSTVELIEVSTRRTLVEKTFETSTESTTKVERSTTDQDDISEAVKQDNKNDLKLGASLTVNQSWGSGNATAVGTMDLQKTQETSREIVHKRMRQQTEKLSTEIKQNYKSTFKTVTETTDTSSKRYVLANTTPDLVNYELRRKMRQVGVQVQDVGTYLCWETFVDEPGRQLGLANLVHIAKPVDLVAVPSTDDLPYPDDRPFSCTAKVSYNLGDSVGRNGPDGFQPLGTSTFGVELPDFPDGYRVLPDTIQVKQLGAWGTDFEYFEFGWRAKIVGKEITLGVYIDGEFDWDNQIDFVVGVNLQLTASADKRKEIDAANAAAELAATKAKEENKRKTKEAFINSAKERIELASGINTRRYEDLREEERIIVYRNLMRALMSDAFYDKTFAANAANFKTLHVLSELINAIFDVDKMLYFVAPEWWKPRDHSRQFLGDPNTPVDFAGNLTAWSDQHARADNYYITDKSQYARMGSSLGWLLQLDGDDLRNAFLNAPWVKAVIPIRPGKELEAINWLQQMNVEGTDGLDSLYQAPSEELNKIRAALGVASVTLRDAITYLCLDVALKHQQSVKVGKYPADEINDDNKVNATPIDKVYEHGFYPLKGGFRAVMSENFEICDQWIEVLPTDQVVPVAVKYDPKTGRQVL
jgi:hypothetical protein